MFKWTFVNRSIGIGLIVGGLYLFGIIGLLVGMVLSSWLNYIVYACLVSKYIGYNMKDQVSSMLPSTILTLIAGSIMFITNALSPLSMYPTALVSTFLFLAIYIGISKIMKIESYIYCPNIVKSVILKKIRRK